MARERRKNSGWKYTLRGGNILCRSVQKSFTIFIILVQISCKQHRSSRDRSWLRREPRTRAIDFTSKRRRNRKIKWNWRRKFLKFYFALISWKAESREKKLEFILNKQQRLPVEILLISRRSHKCAWKKSVFISGNKLANLWSNIKGVFSSYPSVLNVFGRYDSFCIIKSLVQL